MILTCPACDTKYVVKDGAVPPGGRQVRCAACKHSWHQDPEPASADDLAAGEPAGEAYQTIGDEAAVDQTPVEAVEDPPLPEDYAPADPVDEEAEGQWQSGVDELPPEPAAFATSSGFEAEPSIAYDPEPVAPEAAEEFVGYAPITIEAPAPRRTWPIILGVVLLIAAVAAAFWFLAPAEWKARAGIADANATPLELMITTSDRQPLESGNELVAISGRVINPTDSEQNVPPIRAELRDKQTRALVHRWTIAPPARVLAPRSSASFNSAEIDVPQGGDELTVTLGG